MKRLVGSLALIFLCASLAMAGGLLGDLNSDGVVDFDDFFIFAQQFGKRGEPFHPDTVRVTVRDTIRVTVYDTVRVTTPPPPAPGSDKTAVVTTAAGDQLEITQRLLEKTKIAAVGTANGGLYVMPPDGNRRVRISQRWVESFSWRPDGAKILYCEYDKYMIYLINPDGSGEKRVTEGYSPSWSPDGSTIVFARGKKSTENDTILTVKADGTGERLLARGHLPSWSPDGKLIAFRVDTTFSDRSLHRFWYIINPDGTGTRLLTEGYSPSWSPDGGKIVFSKGEGNIDGLYIINADGSGLRRLADGIFAAWSPDGTTLAIVGQFGQGLSTIKVNGSNKTLVWDRQISSFGSWSPDGSKIVFVDRSRGGVMMINPDGTNPVMLVRNEGDVGLTDPSWSPFTP